MNSVICLKLPIYHFTLSARISRPFREQDGLVGCYTLVYRLGEGESAFSGSSDQPGTDMLEEMNALGPHLSRSDSRILVLVLGECLHF